MKSFSDGVEFTPSILTSEIDELIAEIDVTTKKGYITVFVLRRIPKLIAGIVGFSEGNPAALPLLIWTCIYSVVQVFIILPFKRFSKTDSSQENDITPEGDNLTEIPDHPEQEDVDEELRSFGSPPAFTSDEAPQDEGLIKVQSSKNSNYEL